jgi:hypothetical protein
MFFFIIFLLLLNSIFVVTSTTSGTGLTLSTFRETSAANLHMKPHLEMSNYDDLLCQRIELIAFAARDIFTSVLVAYQSAICDALIRPHGPEAPHRQIIPDARMVWHIDLEETNKLLSRNYGMLVYATGRF